MIYVDENENSRHITKFCDERYITFSWSKTYINKSLAEFLKSGSGSLFEHVDVFVKFANLIWIFKNKA